MRAPPVLIGSPLTYPSSRPRRPSSRAAFRTPHVSVPKKVTSRRVGAAECGPMSRAWARAVLRGRGFHDHEAFAVWSDCQGFAIMGAGRSLPYPPGPLDQRGQPGGTTRAQRDRLGDQRVRAGRGPEGGDGEGVDAVAEGACALAEVKDHAGGEPLAEAVAQPAQVLCPVRARGGRCLDLSPKTRLRKSAGPRVISAMLSGHKSTNAARPASDSDSADASSSSTPRASRGTRSATVIRNLSTDPAEIC